MGGLAGPAHPVDAMARMMAGGVRGTGVPAPPAASGAGLDEMARAWVERTCKEQGVPVKVADRAALARVAAVLREVSDAPNRVQARAVKPIQPADRRSDHDVIEHSGNDGAALMQVQVGPLAS